MSTTSSTHTYPQAPKEDIPDPEADEYIELLFGDETSFLPSELRMFKDITWTNRACRLLVEGIREADVFSDKMQQVLSSSQYFNLVNSSLTGKCWVLLKYGHVENANTVAELVKTIMPNVTVHRTDYTKELEYKAFGELLCKENFMIETLNEPKPEKRYSFTGVLINGLSKSLVTAQLEAFFPGAEQIFISRDCVRADGHAEQMDHRYAFAMYKSDEEAEAALNRHDNHQISIDGKTLTLILFPAIKDAVNGEATITYTKVMPERSRRALILHVAPMLRCLTMIHAQLLKFASTGKGPSRKQRKDMTQRKKDCVRKLAAIHKALTADTNRRKSHNAPILDTPQERTMWTTMLDRGREILGREMFNNYMVRTAPPIPGLSIAPRINTAEAMGLPTPQELATKRSATTPASDKAKRGRWEGGRGGGGEGRGAPIRGVVRGGASRGGLGRGAPPSSRGPAPRGRGASGGYYPPVKAERDGYSDYSSDYYHSKPRYDSYDPYEDPGYTSKRTVPGFVAPKDEADAYLGRQPLLGRPRGLLGDYDSPRGRGRGRGEATRPIKHEPYADDYGSGGSGSYDYGHRPLPASAPAKDGIDMSLIMDMKKQISALTTKLEAVGSAVSSAPPPPPAPPASLLGGDGGYGGGGYSNSSSYGNSAQYYNH